MAALFPRHEVESEILERLRDLSGPDSPSLLVLTGTRGSGKTSLLARLAARSRDERPVALVRLEPLACSPEVLERELIRLSNGLLHGSRPRRSGGAYEALLDALRKRSRDSILLLDDLTEVSTLSYSPGVERPLEGFVDALSLPGSGPVLATTRFGFRFGRAFPGVPRYEVPSWTAEEAERAGWSDADELVAASGGVPAYLVPLARARERERSVLQALVVELEPGGTVEAECRATVHELLHRARGYGACKGVLRALADEEGLNLTEVARRLDRTAGATRDYLRWLEEVDLIESRKKRFYFRDALVRLWMRLYGKGTLPDDAERRAEVTRYLQTLAARDGRDEDVAEVPEHEAFTLPELSGKDAGAEELVEID